MFHLSPRLLIATAGALVGLGAHPAHHAAGGKIERLHAVQASSPETSPVSWDVPLIQYCGYWSHFDFRREQSAWPVRGVATAPELGAFGTEHHLLHEEPARGDLFLQWAPRRGAYVHAGIVVEVLARGGYGSRAPYYDLETIEGDTDADGQLGGGVAMRVERRLLAAKGDRFLRWTDLEALHEVASLVGGPPPRGSA
jgi:hypothetical protein